MLGACHWLLVCHEHLITLPGFPTRFLNKAPRRKIHCKAAGKPLKAEANPKKKASPLYKAKYPAAVPKGAITQPQLKALLPPGASCWKGNLGSGHWWVHLPPHPRISRAWTHNGHFDAAMYVLREVWSLWLEDVGLDKAACPVPALFD